MRTKVVIDPNVRVRGQLTFAGLEDVKGPLRVGQAVDVFEPESGLVGEGRVVEIDPAHGLVYLSVDWASIRPMAEDASAVGQGSGSTAYWIQLVDEEELIASLRAEMETGVATSVTRLDQSVGQRRLVSVSGA